MCSSEVKEQTSRASTVLTDFGTLMTNGRISFDAPLFLSGPQNVSGNFGTSMPVLELDGNERS